MKDLAHSLDSVSAAVVRRSSPHEAAEAHGSFLFRCFGADGPLKWEERIENVVCTEGKNQMLDAALAGSSYTVVGPYMGLISSVGFSAVAAGNTAAQINGSNGWKEAGSSTNFPLLSARQLCAWSAASAGAKALSASLTFTCVTTGGTVKGAFIVFGTGASSTIANTSGKLWSAGTFSADKIMDVGDSLAVSYSTSL